MVDNIDPEKMDEVIFKHKRLSKRLRDTDGSPRPLPEGEGGGGTLTVDQLVEYANQAKLLL